MIIVAGKRKPGDPKVTFMKAKNGEQTLMIDEHRYFKERENAMVVFWKCKEFYKSKCEASVATMKKDRSRVVVMNDIHLHLQITKTSPATATTITTKTQTRATTRAPAKRRF